MGARRQTAGLGGPWGRSGGIRIHVAALVEGAHVKSDCLGIRSRMREGSFWCARWLLPAWVANLVQSPLNATLESLEFHPIFMLRWSTTAATLLGADVWGGRRRRRGRREPIPQGILVLDRVRCLHCHGAFGVAMLQQHGTLWRDRRLSLENVLLAVSFFGLAKSIFCVTGRLSSELADFAAVLLAASWTGRVSLDPTGCAASFLGIIHSHFCSSSRCSTVRSFVPFCKLRAPESAKAKPSCHVALLRKRVTQFLKETAAVKRSKN